MAQPSFYNFSDKPIIRVFNVPSQELERLSRKYRKKLVGIPFVQQYIQINVGNLTILFIGEKNII